MDVRKSFVELSESQEGRDERDAFLEAVLRIKHSGVYDQLVATHGAIMKIKRPGSSEFQDMGHSGPVFLPWHRAFLKVIEEELQKEVAGVTLPYWDWTEHELTVDFLWQDDFLGPHPNQTASVFEVASGYFAGEVPPADRPAFWPDGLSGWKVVDILGGGFGTTLRRRGASVRGRRGLAEKSDIDELMRAGDYFEFRSGIETGFKLHNQTHGWVGGHMGTRYSPNDPIFLLNHCYIDRLWDQWQRDGHMGPDFYPAATPNNPGQALDDEMFPWVQNPEEFGLDSQALEPLVEPFFHDRVYRARDVLDTELQLEVSYQ
ncbi:MAG: tyrosinase family protein [Thermoanaerobaculia bacterium]|nr:tyrosinase family protein [Thermoanaerobaculia bacterium]